MTPFWMGIARSFFSAFVVFGSTALTSYQFLFDDATLTSDQKLVRAIVAGGIAAFAVFGTRGVVEGSIDQWRAATGTLSESDVPVASPKVDVVKVA